MALADGVRDLVDVKGAFGDEDDVGAAGDAAVESDPACVAAHDLDDHDAVMSLGGGVYAVEGLADDVAGGVKSESVIGAAEIVVDGLGNADDLGAAFVQLLGDRKRVVTADRDESLDLICFERGQATVDAVGALRGIGARSAQDGAAARQNAAHRVKIEGNADVFQDAAPAFHEPDEFVFISEDALAHDRANDGVQARTIPSAGQHTNLHCLLRCMNSDEASWDALRAWAGFSGSPRRAGSAVAGKNKIIIKCGVIPASLVRSNLREIIAARIPFSNEGRWFRRRLRAI